MKRPESEAEIPTRAALNVFHDRREAGRELADAIPARGFEDPVVFGLPRGGVPVAFEAARALDAPLDVLVARKIGRATTELDERVERYRRGAPAIAPPEAVHDHPR